MTASSELPVLSIRDLTIATAGAHPRKLLNGLSLDIDSGQTVCLVGESGSGKSLTALAIMRLLHERELAITAGTIRLDGEELRGVSLQRIRALRSRKMAMIFQEPMTALNPVMKIRDQLDEVFNLHTSLGRMERYKRILAALDEVHLPDPPAIADRFPHQLSGGQRQRVMIAMALALEPRLLIADEPTTALDVTTQAQILHLTKELQAKHGTAVLFITHDMGVVSDIADKIHVLRRGDTMETGSCADVIGSPRDAYTQTLLSAIPKLTPRPAAEEPDGQPILEVIGLSKTYDFGRRQVHAVDSVSLKLFAGRTLGVVGESGSGKSSLARCVLGLQPLSAGSVKVAGQDLSTLTERGRHEIRQHIQMIFQDPSRSLNPRRTILQSVIEGAVNYGSSIDAASKKAESLMELVGMPKASLSRYPHQFSGGQRQRIAIARALMMDPAVIVADEAVSALDVSVQAQVLDLLISLQHRLGLALLFITHDLRVSARLCDEIIVMKQGQAVEYGTAEQVLLNPRHSYTQALIDAAPGRGLDALTSSWSDRLAASGPDASGAVYAIR